MEHEAWCHGAGWVHGAVRLKLQKKPCVHVVCFIVHDIGLWACSMLQRACHCETCGRHLTHHVSRTHVSRITYRCALQRASCAFLLAFLLAFSSNVGPTFFAQLCTS